MLMGLSKKIFIVRMAIAMIVVSGCGSTSIQTKEDIIMYDGAIKIGLLAPMTGPSAGMGTDILHAVQLVMQDFTTKNPSLRVELIVADGTCTVQGATIAIQKFIDEKVQFVLGGQCMSEMLALSQSLSKNQTDQMLAISLLDTVPNTSELYTFSLYSTKQQAENIMQYMQGEDITKYLLVYPDTDYGLGLATSIRTSSSGVDGFEERYLNNSINISMFSQYTGYDSIIFVPSSVESARDFVGLIEETGSSIPLKNIIIAQNPYIQDISEQLGSLLAGFAYGDMSLIEQNAEIQSFIDGFTVLYPIQTNTNLISLAAISTTMLLQGLLEKGPNVQEIQSYFSSFDAQNPIEAMMTSYYFDADNGIMGLDYLTYVIDSDMELQSIPQELIIQEDDTQQLPTTQPIDIPIIQQNQPIQNQVPNTTMTEQQAIISDDTMKQLAVDIQTDLENFIDIHGVYPSSQGLVDLANSLSGIQFGRQRDILPSTVVYRSLANEIGEQDKAYMLAIRTYGEGNYLENQSITTNTNADILYRTQFAIEYINPIDQGQGPIGDNELWYVFVDSM